MEDLKIKAAKHAARLVKNGMFIGLGSGSTAMHFVREVAALKLDVIGIPTSSATEKLALELGIPLSTPNKHTRLDLAVDGADQIDPDLNLIKGGGGALTREKIVASLTDRFLVIADKTKRVKRFTFPVAVECLEFGEQNVKKRLELLGAEVEKRGILTDNGNPILDARFPEIPDTAKLETIINNIPGVIENGLFPASYVHKAYIADEEGVCFGCFCTGMNSSSCVNDPGCRFALYGASKRMLRIFISL